MATSPFGTHPLTVAMTSTNPHPACLEPDELLGQCRQRRVRRSGPGGQRRNKVETGVVLVHQPTGVDAEAAERRSVRENLGVALRRLRIELALRVRGGAGGDSPSRCWRSRLRNGRLFVSTTHDDFPALVAEALDRLADHDDDVVAAAGQLGCSTSQLVKLLKREPKVLAQVNRRRRESGRHRLG